MEELSKRKKFKEKTHKELLFLIFFSEEVAEEAQRRGLPIRAVGQREMRDKILKHIPKPVPNVQLREYVFFFLKTSKKKRR